MITATPPDRERCRVASSKRHRWGLLARFLLLLTPFFLVLAIPGVLALTYLTYHNDEAKLIARLGSQSGRLAAVLARYDPVADKLFVRDFMATVSSERGILCAELVRKADGVRMVSHPPRVGCGGRTDGELLELPVGADGVYVLSVRLSASEIMAENKRHALFAIGVLLVAFLIALLTSAFGFRRIVSRPLRSLTDAIEHTTATGERQTVEIAANGELETVIKAFNDLQRRDVVRGLELAQAYERLHESQGDLTRLNRLLELRVQERTAELAERTKTVELMGEIAAAANEATSIDSALQISLDLMCDYMGWPVGHAYLVSHDDGTLRPMNNWRLEEPERFVSFREATTKITFKPGDGLIGRVYTNRMPAWVPDIGEDASFHRAVVAREAGLVTALAIPVLVGDEVEAVLEFLTVEHIEPDPDLLDVMLHVGSQIGRVFERFFASEEIVGAKEAAERASRAKSDFLTNMSHELRTPLNAVVGFSEIMSTAPDDGVAPRYRRYAQDILSSSRHLLDLINDLLDISKIEAGHFELAREAFALTPDLVSVSELVAPQYDARRLSLRTELKGVDGATMIDADRRALRQIVLNLLSNALKFSREGGSVEVCAAAVAGDLRLTVTDHGVGIAKQDLARVFERFEQVREPMGGAVGGTGIGLPLSRTLAEMHGGTLELDSEPGVGTTAILTLPDCLRQAEAAETRVEAVADGAVAELAFAAPPRVLVAEDHPVNRSLMEELLGSLGCEVAMAEDGEQAVAAVMRRPCDLVFMDLQMPKMDGFAATRAIRELEGAGRHVPIVALSANVLPEHRARSLAAGMDDHVGKPVSRADIAGALARWLQGEAAVEEAAGDTAAGAPVEDGPVEEALIDTAMLDEFIAMAGADRIAALVAHLAEDCAARLPEIEAALAAGDHAAVRSAAHRLKGALAGLGARHAPKLAQQIEALADAGDGAALATRLPNFSTACHHTLDALDDFVGKRRTVAVA